MEKREPLYTIAKLKKIIANAIHLGDTPKALAGINSCADLAYRYNQWYVDEELESWSKDIEKTLHRTTLTQECLDKQTVLFYDGFGMDTRGLALIYLKAIAALGYHLVYITPDSAKDNQPEIQKILASGSHERQYLSNRDSYIDRIHAIVNIFEQYKPAHAFFYSYPHDIEAVVAFEHYSGIISRYQINLTDHAFWLGKNAFDYCIEFRDYGASISYHHRDIPAEKLRMLPYYPYVNKEIPFSGFPFNVGTKKVLFSGGSLYKTIDEELTFYKMVEKILQKHPDAVFVYAGTGDSSGIKWLQEQCEDRVYHIAERSDLYQVLKHSCLYINTYPIAGSLMMQYAAISGTIPITLKKRGDDDADGMLIGQDDLGIVFTDMNDLLEEVDKLLVDESYKTHKSKLLENSLITEEAFQKGLQDILHGENTEYPLNIREMDTSVFLENYKSRISKTDISEAIGKIKNLLIWPYFPGIAWNTILSKMKRLLKRR